MLYESIIFATVPNFIIVIIALKGLTNQLEGLQLYF